MPINTDILTTLSGADRLNRIDRNPIKIWL